ncbi:hypothetical protein [Microcoleus sp. S13_C5]
MTTVKLMTVIRKADETREMGVACGAGRHRPRATRYASVVFGVPQP